MILNLILSLTPISLLVIYLIKHSVLKYHSKFTEVDTIITEALGILTEPDPNVRSIIFDNYRIDLTRKRRKLPLFDQESQAHLKIPKTHLQDYQCIQLINKIISLCHYAKTEAIEQKIKDFLNECEIYQHPVTQEHKVIDQLPSNPEKKISTVVALEKNTENIFAFSKGHPEKILERCTRILINNEKHELNNRIRLKLIKRIKNLNSRGHKVIAFAYKGLPKKRYQKYTSKFAENDLIFVGLIGLGHFINPALLEPIKAIKKRGIKIYLTAKTRERKAVGIAHELSIINPQYFEAIEASYLDTLDDNKLSKMLKNREKDFVFSNLLPKHSDRIKTILSSNGHKILKTDIEESTLTKLLTKIEKSKRIKANSKKIIIHTIYGKSIVAGLTIISILFHAPLPFTITQLLIIDLLINGSLQSALNSEKEKHHHFKTQKILGISFLNLTTIGFLYFFYLIQIGWFPKEAIIPGQASEIALITTAMLQIINAYRVKNDKEINLYLILTSITTLLLTILITNLPPSEWGMVIFLLATVELSSKTYRYLAHKYGH